MSHYRNSSNIKLALIAVGFILIIGLLAYSNSIVNQLRDDNREIVKVYSEIIAKTVNEESDANLSFVFDEIIKKVQFPIIYSDAEQNPVYSRNLGGSVSPEALQKPMAAMDLQNEPIPIAFNDPASVEPILLGYLHYGDSDLIRKLQWLPYLEIGAVALFIFVGFIGFNAIRNSEKRNIWVGMAKETAHQLGTPVSALMGWVDRIKMHPEESKIVVDEMESDLDQIETGQQNAATVWDGFVNSFRQYTITMVNTLSDQEDQAQYVDDGDKKLIKPAPKAINISNI